MKIKVTYKGLVCYMQNIKITMMPRIYIFHIFQIMLVYVTIYTNSAQKTLDQGQKIIPACMIGKMVECRSELEIRLNKDSVAYQQLKQIEFAYALPKVAASEGYTQLINVLLSSGVPIEYHFIIQKTMLHCAAQYEHFDTVHLLLTHGANVNARELFGETPLHICARTGNVNITELLLQYGADINAKNDLGNTPLHVAVYEAHGAVIQCLLKHGCDKSIVNDWGSTAEKLARHKNEEIQKLFSST